jgi:hypothetical protein
MLLLAVHASNGGARCLLHGGDLIAAHGWIHHNSGCASAAIVNHRVVVRHSALFVSWGSPVRVEQHPCLLGWGLGEIVRCDAPNRRVVPGYSTRRSQWKNSCVMPWQRIDSSSMCQYQFKIGSWFGPDRTSAGRVSTGRIRALELV